MKNLSMYFVIPICSVVVWAQSVDGFLTPQQSSQVIERSWQLMDSSQATIPGLAQATALLASEAKHANAKLKDNGRPMPSEVYAFLVQLRAYLTLSDALPKPTLFSEQHRGQFSELRANVDLLDGHFRALMVRTEGQLRPADRDNLRRYADANAKLAAPSNDKPRVLFYGDSITDGWKLSSYFPDKDYVNRGISGQITGEMLGRMQADVIANKPAAMIILAGTNDLARKVSVDTVKNNLKMISELAEAHKIKVILSSILPVSDHHKDVNPRYEMTKIRPPEKIREINAWMAAFAKQKGFVYCNYYDEMVESSGQLKAELAADGLHPNEDGYKIMAPAAQAAIDRALAIVNPVQQKGTKKRPSY